MKRLVAFTLVVLCCLACHPSARTSPEPDRELPPVPSQVISIMGPIPVIWVDSLRNTEGQPILGGYDPVRRAIYLRRSLLQDLRAAHAVLVHEQVHVVMQDAGLANLIPPQVVQALADALASYRVAEMIMARRKP